MSVCLLCDGPVTESVDLVPGKPWWPSMVTCANEECVAFGVHVAADPDALERGVWESPDRTEPKFAYFATERGFVSTIYRRSSAMEGPRWYYETHAYLSTVESNRRWLYDYGTGYPKAALRAHAILSKRLARLYPVAIAA